MIRPALRVFRPFGLALASFILLNLVLAIERPALSANQVWLYVGISEPLLSAIAALLGAALLVPHAAGARPAVRLVVAGILCGFLALVAANILGFYQKVRLGRIVVSVPVPFSALIALILAGEAARVIWWTRAASALPLPARRFLGGAAVAAAFLLLMLAHIVTFGTTDYAPAAGSADAAVVLGARVYADGSLSPALEDRLATGIRLLDEGRVRFLILSGGVEPGGRSEPEAMAAHARLQGVSSRKLILDEKGRNTYASAKSCGDIARARGFEKLLVVSQYWHNARVKLIFERVGTSCYTVPARPRRLVREGYFLLRETIALVFYYVYYQ